jgi:DNA-binding response OmpR family regulator
MQMREHRWAGVGAPGMLVSTTKQQHRPVVLMVGQGEPMEVALRVALDRHGLQVKSAPSADTVDDVASVAPDLVLLMGDASAGGGEAMLRHLALHPASAVVPVALVAEEPSLDGRLRAFRSGAVAVIARSPSADAMARQVAQVVRELPERTGAATGELGEATLDDLMAWVKREVRTGILTVGLKDADEQAPMRLVLGAGQPVADALEAFVARLKPLIARAEPLRYEFQEEAGSRLRLLDELLEEAEADADPSLLDGLRILLLDADAGRADALATTLRAHGSQVGVSEPSVRGLERVGILDPEVVVLDGEAIEGPGFDAIRQLRQDVRMRWSSLLVVPWDELWPDPRQPPPLLSLLSQLAPLVEGDRDLTERASKELRFDARLELTGPARLLRALVRAGPTLHVTVRSQRATVEVDLSEGLVVGARATTDGDTPQELEGAPALAVLLALGTARVHIERRGHPSVANLMSPVDEALDAASRERSPVPISNRPPPPSPAKPSAPNPKAAGAPPAKAVPKPPRPPARATVKGHAVPRQPPPPAPAKAAGAAPPPRPAKPARPTTKGTPPPPRTPSPATPGRAKAAPPPQAATQWENEDTQPPQNLHFVEAARRQAVRSHPPPAAQDAAAPAAPTPASPPKPQRPVRQRTLVGVAPPQVAGASPSPAVDPAAPLDDVAVPVDFDPLDDSDSGPATEEIDLADMLEPSNDAADPALAKTIAPGMAGFPLPPPPPSSEAARELKHTPTFRESKPTPIRTQVPPEVAGPGPDAAADPHDMEATEVMERDDDENPFKRKTPRWLVLGALITAAGATALGTFLFLGTNASPGDPTSARSEAVPSTAAEPTDDELGLGMAAEDEDEASAAAPDAPKEPEAAAEAPPEAEGAKAPEPEVEREPAPQAEAAAPASKPAPEPFTGDPQRESSRLVLEAQRMVQRRELPDAKAALERALELDPQNVRGFAALAEVHIAMGNGKAALEWAELAVKWRKRRAPYRVLLGDALRLTGDAAGARRAYQQALELDPKNRDARQRLQ